MPFNTRQPSLTINYTITVVGSFPNIGDRSFGISFLRLWGFAANPGGTADTNGALVPTADPYAALFSLIRDQFGGDGRYNFALPNLDGRAAISRGQGPGLSNFSLGQTSGAASESLVQSMLPVALGGTGASLPTTEPAQTVTYGIISDLPLNYTGVVGFTGQILATASLTAHNSIDYYGHILTCDGSLKNIAEYPLLFSVIGATYGGDGITTFAVPDLRGRVPVGAGNGIALGERLGSEQVALTAANLPVEMGGSATPINNYGPSLGINFLVAVLGEFPSSQVPPDRAGDNPTIGEIIMFAGSTVPESYALANGQLLSRNTYPQLNALFGNTYGSGDAANFALPDLRGRSAIDESATSPIGTVSGSATTVLTMADIPALNLVGTAGDDIFYGGNLGDTISGGLGADRLFGNGGIDTINGGGGDDIIDGGTGADIMTGGTGNDVYYVDNVGDTFIELTGEGIDELRTTLTSTVLPANFERLAYIGTGGGTLDTGTGATGAITLTGGSGDDRFIVRSGAFDVAVAGGAGLDTLDLSAFTTPLTLNTDTVTVQTIDRVVPFTGIEAFVLGSGNDIARLGGGNFTVAGGAGDDIYYDRDGNDAIIEQPGDGNDTIYAGTDYLLPANVENLIYTGTGAASLTGNAGNNMLDTGTTATGAVTLNGGDGDDVLVVRGGAFGVGIIGGAGVDTLRTERDLAIIPDDIENLVYIGTGSATLIGNAGANRITGGVGNDTIHGNGGADILNGGAGSDRLFLSYGASGSNIDGGADTDTLVVNSSVGSLAGLMNIEALELNGGANLTLTGAQFNNGLLDTSAVSGTGTLTVNMATTDELFYSTLFNFAGNGVSVVVNGSSGIDVIKAGNTSHTIFGGEGDDHLTGGLAVDTIDGGSGNDKIIGRGGADILTGGMGADTFRYIQQSHSGLGAAADRITDYSIGEDKLGFSQIDTDLVTPGDQAFAFVGNGAFSGSGIASIRYMDSGANLLVQADVNGDGIADMEIILQGLSGGTLTAADFIL